MVVDDGVRGTVVHAAGVVVTVAVAGGVVVVEVGVVVGAHGSAGAGACGAELGVVGVVDGCAVATAPPPVATNAAIIPAVNTARGAERDNGFGRGNR